MAAKELFTISEKTNGSFETNTIDLYLFVFDSSVRILLISSTEVFFEVTKVISEIEPTVTGVRIAIPSNFPSNFGSALIVALAAPVVAGTKFIAAARPILILFLDGASTSDCEAV